MPYTPDVPSYKCAYRHSIQIVFKKKIPIFGSKIEKGSIEKGHESFGIWTGWAQTKIEEYRGLNPLPKIVKKAIVAPPSNLPAPAR